MGYLNGKILIYLIPAVLIGAAVAWLVREVRCRAREKELLAELKQTHSTLDAAEGEIRRQEASLNDLRSVFEAQNEQFQARINELESLEGDHREAEKTIARLETQLMQLRDEKEIELGNLREHLSTLEPLQGQLDKSQAERNRLQGEVQRLTDQIQAEQQRLSAEPASGACEKDAEIERLKVLPQEKTAKALSAGKSFDRSGGKDDLKKIAGIGPVLEKTLNRLGVTTFAQVGRFVADDVERVSNALNGFPDRIVRDDWVGGARKLYQEKYGKPLD